MALLTTALLTTSRLASDDDAEHADDAADVEAEPVDEDARLEGGRRLEDGGLARHRAEGPAHVVDFGVCVREVGKLAVREWKRTRVGCVR